MKIEKLQIEIIFNNILYKEKTISDDLYEIINKNILKEIEKETNYE